jgi:hypothetical protein
MKVFIKIIVFYEEPEAATDHSFMKHINILLEDFNTNIGIEDILKTRLGTTGYMKLAKTKRSTHSLSWIWLLSLLIQQHKDVKTLRKNSIQIKKLRYTHVNKKRIGDEDLDLIQETFQWCLHVALTALDNEHTGNCSE